MVMAPVVRGRKGEYGKLFEELAGGWATRGCASTARCTSLPVELNAGDRNYKHDIEVVVDRLVDARGDRAPRLTDSVETALKSLRGASPDRDGREERRER